MLFFRQISPQIQQLLKIALLIFFIGHYSNVTMFYHAHDIDGKLYFHSHYFWHDSNQSTNDSQSKSHSHSHTENQLALIDIFNEISWSHQIHLPEIPSRIALIGDLLITALNRAHYANAHSFFQLRAPPVFELIA